MVGFCTLEVKPLGPVQAYVAELDVTVLKFIVDPSQTGELLDAEGAAQDAALIGVAVVPGIGQPKASKIPGLDPLLNVFPETLPVPKMYALLLMMLSHNKYTQSVVAVTLNFI